MNKHEIIFEKMKHFLKEKLGDRVKEYENGTYVGVNKSGFWMCVDESGIAIGYSLIQDYYEDNAEQLQQALERIAQLLTQKIRILEYRKGTQPFKYEVHVVNDANEYIIMGKATNWLYPYWKKTAVMELVNECLLNENEVEQELKEFELLL